MREEFVKASESPSQQPASGQQHPPVCPLSQTFRPPDGHDGSMGVVIGSPWQAGRKRKATPPLAGDLTTDVCVVGAGIAGLSIGLEAALAGFEVVVLDADRAGGGETGYTTAHLTNV